MLFQCSIMINSVFCTDCFIKMIISDFISEREDFLFIRYFNTLVLLMHFHAILCHPDLYEELLCVLCYELRNKREVISKGVVILFIMKFCPCLLK